VDLKGYIPKSLLNMGIGAGKTNEIKEMYEKVKPYQDALWKFIKKIWFLLVNIFML